MTDSAEAGMAWDEVAASAYRAYSASTGNKNFRGEEMPGFASLPAPIRVAWQAAVRQAVVCTHYGSGQAAPDESRWKGWLPPG